MSLEQIICHGILAAFVVYMVKDAEILAAPRGFITRAAARWKVSRRWNWLGGFTLKLISCPFCISFWFLSFLAREPGIMFTSPVAAAMIYKLLIFSEKV